MWWLCIRQKEPTRTSHYRLADVETAIATAVGFVVCDRHTQQAHGGAIFEDKAS